MRSQTPFSPRKPHGQFNHTGTEPNRLTDYNVFYYSDELFFLRMYCRFKQVFNRYFEGGPS